jgi:XTP/dITP diphosphohydrolase
MNRTILTDLLIATGNTGKAAEIRVLLGNLPIGLRTLIDFPNVRPVAESGNTYEENAVLKARSYARQTALFALADDSGLEVEALGGAPGVISARYAGQGASDNDRVAFLLRELAHAPSANRSARFVCVIALADSTSAIVDVESGVCEGQIIDEPRGANGFGYDPIFIPQGFDKTFAELPNKIKNDISHRGRALQAARAFLERLLARESGIVA